MRTLHQILTVLFTTAITTSICLADDANPGGILDRPLVPLTDDVPAATPLLTTDSSPEALENLVETVDDEVEILKQLPEAALERKAAQGERAAQFVMAETFTSEAAGLSFVPAAANDALSDAVRWYSIAAMRGFPGAPSLDRAGLEALPIRAFRGVR